MASSKIKGITIVINGETTKLSKALKDVDKQVYSLNSDLKGLNQALKLDPTNTELLAQKQDVLARNIKATADRLNTLKEAQKQMGSYNKLTDEQKQNYNQLSIEISKAENALNGMNKELEETKSANVSGGIKEVKENVDQLGKSTIKAGELIKANLISQAIISGVKTLASTLKSAVKVLNDWSSKAKNLEEQEQKFRTAIKNTTNATEEDVKAYVKLAEVKEKNGVLSKAAILNGYQELATYTTRKESIEQLTDAMLDMTVQQYGMNASEEQTLSIATRLGKALSNGDYSGLAKMGYYFTDAEKKAMKFGTEQDRVNALLEAITGSVGGMNKALAQTDAGKLKIAQSYIEDFQVAAGKAFNSFKAKVAANFLPQITRISNALVSIFEGEGILKNNVDVIANSLISVIKKVAEDILPVVIEVVKSIIDSIIQFINKDNGQFIKMAVDILSNLVKFIINNLPLILDAAIKIVGELAIGIAEAAPDLIPAVVDCVLEIVNTLVNNVDLLVEAAVKLAIGIGKGLILAVPKIIEKVPEIVKNIVDKFNEKLGEFVDIGKEIVKGIGRGIEAEWNYLKVKAKNLPLEIAQWIKEKLGIHSPSKVMRDEVGKNIVLGIAEGINDTVGEVELAMSNLSDKVETSVNPTINPTANTNPLYVTIDKFYNNRGTDVQQLAEELEFYRKNTALAKGGV